VRQKKKARRTGVKPMERSTGMKLKTRFKKKWEMLKRKDLKHSKTRNKN
jgi:hypothetical protein